MKYVWSIVFVIVLFGLWGLPIYSLVIKEKSTSQQLIDGKIESIILINKQVETIESQMEEIEELATKNEVLSKTALEVADENYALHQIIEDMVVSMKQMLEYIESLEDRDA